MSVAYPLIKVSHRTRLHGGGIITPAKRRPPRPWQLKGCWYKSPLIAVAHTYSSPFGGWPYHGYQGLCFFGKRLALQKWGSIKNSVEMIYANLRCFFSDQTRRQNARKDFSVWNQLKW